MIAFIVHVLQELTLDEARELERWLDEDDGGRHLSARLAGDYNLDSGVRDTGNADILRPDVVSTSLALKAGLMAIEVESQWHTDAQGNVRRLGDLKTSRRGHHVTIGFFTDSQMLPMNP
ncbi:hypothetical protein BKM77_16875 [Pseudomonas syringae]|nr:hypothetical protein BKM77_16875 [Pseudomonas syringae]